MLFCIHLLPIPLTFPSLLPTHVPPNFMSFVFSNPFSPISVAHMWKDVKGEVSSTVTLATYREHIYKEKHFFPPEIMNFQ